MDNNPKEKKMTEQIIQNLLERIKKEHELIFVVPHGKAIANKIASELENEGYNVDFERIDKERLKVFIKGRRK